MKLKPQSKRSEDGRAVFLRKMTRQSTRRARRTDAEHVATFARTSLEGGIPGAEQAGIERSEIAPAPAGPEGQRRKALATATSRRPVTRQRHPQMFPCRLTFQPPFRSPFRAQGDETSPLRLAPRRTLPSTQGRSCERRYEICVLACFAASPWSPWSPWFTFN
jgi:hypothetical protein